MGDLGGVLVQYLEMKPTYYVSYFRTVRIGGVGVIDLEKQPIIHIHADM